ncbi:hypothetical protein WME97_25425 [Sorangium sp. So ce367]|uniref:hypothetical protein n=1 Tax=Sorangium sp. So ce367 TaxID=3133305 RepID=UPI003F613FA6
MPDEIVTSLRTAQPDEIVWMGRVPARIDFLQTVAGIAFEPSSERRVTADVAEAYRCTSSAATTSS